LFGFEPELTAQMFDISEGRMFSPLGTLKNRPAQLLAIATANRRGKPSADLQIGANRSAPTAARHRLSVGPSISELA